jgi:hypothetical protein
MRDALALFNSVRGRWLITEAFKLAIGRLRKESDIAHRRISDIEDMTLLQEFFLTPTTRQQTLASLDDTEVRKQHN